MAMITNETAEVGLTSTRSEETKGRSHSVYKFDNIGFTVKVKNKSKEVVDKKIIDGISATVKSGRVLAIMGPSGAGKTTLINVSTRVETQGFLRRCAFGDISHNCRKLTNSNYCDKNKGSYYDCIRWGFYWISTFKWRASDCRFVQQGLLCGDSAGQPLALFDMQRNHHVCSTAIPWQERFSSRSYC